MSKSKSGKSRIPQADPHDTQIQSARPVHHHHHSQPAASGVHSADSITAAALVAPLSITPQVVQIIDTTKWSKPSPDPSGLAFVPGGSPGTGTLLECDSEVDETPFFRTDNLFHLSATGVFNSSSSLESFTIEPTGIVYASPLGHLFISDDDANRVFEVSASSPGGPPINSFSTKTFATDVEDIAYDPATNHLFVIEGSTGNF